uniref:Tub domain-containing protein n=1 Tax=Macrostomum lignano TaxID=282301 RepID=A0A1I8F705_9PLAT
WSDTAGLQTPAAAAARAEKLQQQQQQQLGWASSRINAALSNIILGSAGSAAPPARLRFASLPSMWRLCNGRDGTKSSVFTNVDSEDQLEFLLQYRSAMESFGSISRLNQPVFATVPSRVDAPMSTAFESGSADAVFTRRVRRCSIWLR